MRQQPTGEDLLACARKVLRDEVLPALPEDRKHVLRMAMNAMSIAERQMRNGDAPERQELSQISALTGFQSTSLADGLRKFSKMIRDGKADPGEEHRGALMELLRSTARQRLSESNPKALAAQPS